MHCAHPHEEEALTIDPCDDVPQSAQADGEAVAMDPDLGGHELVLHRLAGIYGGPDEQRAEKAFRTADTDGSGFLDFRELCNVVKVGRTGGIDMIFSFTFSDCLCCSWLI